MSFTVAEGSEAYRLRFTINFVNEILIHDDDDDDDFLDHVVFNDESTFHLNVNTQKVHN